jgi:hypothetical protein
VFGNRVLRGIFEPKREEVVGGCRNLGFLMKISIICMSPNNISVIKPRRVK